MQPKVSVIVPNYNHAPYLRQRLDSIFSQTFQDFEVIILDDCSTDNSKDIIEEYRNRVQTSHIVFNETNSGTPFKQWAKGFDLAQGEYIWIAESDDWADIHFLETLVPILDSNVQTALVFSASNWVYPNHEKSFLLQSNNFEINGTEFIKTSMICGNSIHNASAVLFRSSNISQFSDNYSNFKGAGDYLFWINICEQGNVAFVASCLNNFRRHDDSTTQKCDSNGTVYKENLAIFKYMCNKGYLTFLEKKCVASFYLVKIKRSLNKLYAKELIDIWQKEVGSLFFYQTLSFLVGLCIRLLPNVTKKKLEKKIVWAKHYCNYNTLELIWNAFHIPNTNFRIIFRKKTK